MQTPARAGAAMLLGVAPEKVKLNTTFIGGGFGRRGRTDYVNDAVEVAKTVPGTPVKVVWSREDDMQQDYYRPASYVKMSAALDANGLPAAMTVNVACPSFPNVGRNGVSSTAVEHFEQSLYEIPNYSVPWAGRRTRSSSRALLTNWPLQPVRILWNSAVGCWRNRRACWAC
jgi:isoquinoline 1-oxidoreductase beta subunit